MQLKIKVQVSQLATLRDQRQGEASSGRISLKLLKQMEAKQTVITGRIQQWLAWQRSPSTSTFSRHWLTRATILPWRALSTAGGLTKEHLQLKLHLQFQESCRCTEELGFVKGDAAMCMQMYMCGKQCLPAPSLRRSDRLRQLTQMQMSLLLTNASNSAPAGRQAQG